MALMGQKNDKICSIKCNQNGIRRTTIKARLKRSQDHRLWLCEDLVTNIRQLKHCQQRRVAYWLENDIKNVLKQEELYIDYEESKKQILSCLK